MTVRQIYDSIFTEYPKIGFSPAIIVLAICAAIAATVVVGGVSLGKAYFAHTPAAEATHS
jgi:hypothetical protein